MRRFRDAFGSILGFKTQKKSIEIWGSGKPRREFLHVDDAAKATIIISELSDKKFQILVGKKLSHINLSYGIDYKVNKIVDILKKISNFKGKIKRFHNSISESKFILKMFQYKN